MESFLGFREISFLRTNNAVTRFSFIFDAFSAIFCDLIRNNKFLATVGKF